MKIRIFTLEKCLRKINEFYFILFQLTFISSNVFIALVNYTNPNPLHVHTIVISVIILLFRRVWWECSRNDPDSASQSNDRWICADNRLFQSNIRTLTAQMSLVWLIAVSNGQMSNNSVKVSGSDLLPLLMSRN